MVIVIVGDRKYEGTKTPFYETLNNIPANKNILLLRFKNFFPNYRDLDRNIDTERSIEAKIHNILTEQKREYEHLTIDFSNGSQSVPIFMNGLAKDYKIEELIIFTQKDTVDKQIVIIEKKAVSNNIKIRKILIDKPARRIYKDKRICVIRHGEMDPELDNDLNRIIGFTSRFIGEAKLIISSPTRKARITAEFAQKSFSGSVIKVMDIQEFSFIDHSKISSNDQKRALIQQYWSRDPSWKHGENSESFNELLGRLKKFHDEIITCPEKDILVITHDKFMKLYHWYVSRLNDDGDVVLPRFEKIGEFIKEKGHMAILRVNQYSSTKDLEYHTYNML